MPGKNDNSTHLPWVFLNIPSQLEAWYKEVTRPSTIPKCTGYESKVSSSQNIPTFINFEHSRASSWQNLHTWFGHDFPAGQFVFVRSSFIAATT